MIGMLALGSCQSFAADSSGKTANGCSYSVINGKYLYDCSGAASNQQKTPTASASTTQTTISTTVAPLDSYSSVPVFHSSETPQPLIVDKQSRLPTTPPKKQARIETPAAAETSREAESSEYKDHSYVGFLVGGTTLTAPGASNSTGIGLAIGSNIDDYMGLELDYSYASQDLNLGLNSRASIPGSTVTATDSSLNANLVVAELQFHATDTSSRFRPYVGVGLGWKHSSLEDAGQGGFGGNATIPGSSVSQSSFGTDTTIGAKIRFNENFQGVLDFRYFLPVVKSSASVSEDSTDGSQGRLTAADSPLTKSSLYQFQAGLLYLF